MARFTQLFFISGLQLGLIQNRQIIDRRQERFAVGGLDQAGGELGYGFGNSRFAEMILRHARLPMNEQCAAFKATLDEYQGDYPQRDDITMLCFRFD